MKTSQKNDCSKVTTQTIANITGIKTSETYYTE